MEPLTLSKIFEYLKNNRVRLTQKEETTVRSIFEQVDLQDENGDYIVNDNGKKGDGKLNNVEWGIFRTVIETISDLSHKMNEFLWKTTSDYYTASLNKQKAESDNYDYFSMNKTFIPSKFDEENLRKSFPEESYDIVVDGDTINIKDKNNPNKNNIILSVITDDHTNTKLVYYVKNGERVGLEYDNVNCLSRRIIRNDSESITTKYKGGYKEKETNNNTGVVSHFDDRGVLSKRHGTLKMSEGDMDDYDAYYENGKMTSIVNLQTGVKTVFKEKGKEETLYDGAVLADKYLENNSEINEEFINKLSIGEKIDFCKNINIFADYTYEKLEFVFNMQMNIIKELGGYTKDFEGYITTYLNEVKSSDNSSKDNKLTGKISALLEHINSRIRALQFEKKELIKEPNGNVDADFAQGYIGDCWLLSSIKAIASSRVGRRKLNNMISIQKENGELVSVTVKLQGKNYVISSEELHSAVEYSAGDLDIRALEIAINRFCIENGYKDITAGNLTETGLSILLGDASKLKEYDEIENCSDDSAGSDYFYKQSVGLNFVEKFKTGNYIATVGNAYEGMFAFDAETGEAVRILQSHAYTVLKIDKKYVYLVNPHDSSKTLQLEQKQFAKTFMAGSLFEI